MSTPSTSDSSCTPRSRAADISLPVVPKPNVARASRMSRWRAAVLIAIHVAIAAHIIQWLWTGSTISPIEPSEAMYTIELGKLNAGFVTFVIALLSTVLFGRFFCGWACHVVALQDLCAHLMSKLGVRPKPWRTRLLPWWTALIGFYMFLWPAFKRHLLFPLMTSAGVERPAWLKDVAEFPGLSSHFVVTDFWATFAPWPVAIAFLAVCGFATVYFLGSKAFCTYACPYGGFFAPLDRISVGRIVVSDACHGCGHCTAACSSNVRVHQEIKEFGKIVDPGCMKCLDCVSVCPNDALSFRFAAPAAFSGRKAPAAPRPKYDLLLWEEVVLFVAGIALFLGFRQMLNMVPLLMAAGLAVITTFLVWSLWRMVRDPNVRIQNAQLRLKGTWKPSGFVFAALTIALVGAATWSGAVRFQFWRAGLIDSSLETPQSVVFSPEYQPSPFDREQAGRALRYYAFADAPAHGGFGWEQGAGSSIRRAWLSAVAGDLGAAEEFMVRAIKTEQPAMSVVADLVGLRHARLLRGATPERPVDPQPTLDLIEAAQREVLALYPDYAEPKVALAQIAMARGDANAAAATAAEVLASPDRTTTVFARVAAAEVLMACGKPDEARAGLESLRSLHPREALVHASLGRLYYFSGKLPEALSSLERATEIEPRSIHYWRALEELAVAAQQMELAERARREAEALEAQTPSKPPGGL
ncbi:MAG: 4Fe-4S binding protein [Leptolyngbya sp. PLA1]|nr:4Fe-4S binding protein [Leptolyngbya sp. PLA1]